MDLLAVALLLSLLVIGIVVLSILMARRDRAAGRTTAMHDPAGVSRYSPGDVLRAQTNAVRVRTTGGLQGPFL